MQGIPAALPFGMPGMGEEMEGAMQQAAQPGRHSKVVTRSTYHAFDLEEPLLAPHASAVASDPAV